MKAWIIENLKKVGAWAWGLVKKYKALLIAYGLGVATVLVFLILGR